ncbi:hypothetical protein [Flavobacterium selenitireducens]|uniref:hypothetical protein n=1 Tax=Flavobacterium selenitireducens TaxID=2722704 RepID=UPI00168AA6D1|nr:hypothetical protein [Flavobacterium selenitireducens]MBD3581320.1 hypothetical protein [Flavobacterium selenitireducens]
MKVSSVFVISIIIFCSCNKSVETNRMIVRSDMSKVLDSFAKSNPCKDCTYEMYIDKQDPHTYLTTLYVGEQSLTGQENVDNNQESQYSVDAANGTSFDVYTGIEHYFNNTDKRRKGLKRSEIDNSKTVIWTVKDSFGKLTITKQDFAYPYMPLPRPAVDIKDFIKKAK